MKKLLIFVIGILTAAGAQAQSVYPVLERYVIELGTPSMSGFSPGVELRMTDRFFGGGNTQARITLLEHSSSSTLWERPMLLSLEVERKVRDDEVTFALLVFHITVEGYNDVGELIYSRNLKGFEFGDSAPGKWHERLAELPTGLTSLNITFYGNYE